MNLESIRWALENDPFTNYAVGFLVACVTLWAFSYIMRSGDE